MTGIITLSLYVPLNLKVDIGVLDVQEVKHKSTYTHSENFTESKKHDRIDYLGKRYNVYEKSIKISDIYNLVKASVKWTATVKRYST